MAERTPRIILNESDYHSIPQVLWNEAVIREGKKSITRNYWETTNSNPPNAYPDNFELVCEYFDPPAYHLFAKTGASLIYTQLRNKQVSLGIADDHRPDPSIIDQIKTIFPEVKKDNDLLPVTFWSQSNSGGKQYERFIDGPTWEQIRPNYQLSAVESLDKIMTFKKLPAAGKLMLFHGPPGTGKTHIVRALSQEWKSWCKLNFISDPEGFLADPNYIFQVLMEDSSDFDDDDIEIDQDSIPNPTKAKLLVMEDAGELIKIDAKEQIGQALSRLLNMTDGLIGQGFHHMILITTNEELGRLNPAVTRPGRCIANIEFKNLSLEEAKRWSTLHQIDLPGTSQEYSLSELYALKEGLVLPSTKPRALGFGS